VSLKGWVIFPTLDTASSKIKEHFDSLGQKALSFQCLIAVDTHFKIRYVYWRSTVRK